MRHQIAASEKGHGKRGFGYFMEMGTGKTKVDIDDFAELVEEKEVQQHLIFAPKGVYMNWPEREMPVHTPDWLQESSVVGVWCGAHTVANKNELRALFHDDPSRPSVCVMNIEAIGATDMAMEFARRFVRRRPTMITWDESTSIKNPDAIRTRMSKQLALNAAYRRVLSGWPNPNGPMDLFSQIDVIEPGYLGSNFYAFRSRYAILQKQFFTIPGQFVRNKETGDLEPKMRQVQQIVDYQNLEELRRRLSPINFRIKKEDCLDLPPSTYRFRDVEMTPEQRRIYREVRENATAAINGLGDYVTVNQVITLLLRLHQIAIGHVVDEVGIEHELPSNRPAQLLEDLEECESQVVIWCSYQTDIRRVVAAITKAWGPGMVAEYHGGIKHADANDNLKAFLAGTRKYFVGTPAKGGYGNTMTNAADTIFYSNTDNLEHRLQAESRTHRHTQTRPTTFTDLRCRGTVEERIIENLREKIDLATDLMGDGYKKWLI